jgi:general secretion pathway protein K
MLVAIMLVALGTIVAASIAYESAMTARRGAAGLSFDESILIAQGAEALAAYGLREVWRNDKTTTNPAQPWSKPVGPLEVVPGVMLDAVLEDVTGRFNLNLLVKDDATGMADPEARMAFQELLTQLNIEPAWADKIIDWIDPDFQPMPEGAEDSVYMGQNPPYLTPSKYITSTTELLALPGFGRDRYDKLAPYITALPPDAKINVCSASAQVLDAFLFGERDYSTDPQALVKNRETANGCFPRLTDYDKVYQDAKMHAPAVASAALNNPTGMGVSGTSTGGGGAGGIQGLNAGNHFVEQSGYFRLTSHVTIGTTEFNLYSLLQRDGTGNSRPILRTYTPD